MRAKTSGNESGQQKGNMNMSSFQQKWKIHITWSNSAPALKHKGHYNSWNS